MTLVNKTNYWGGNTYRQEDGYRMRNNFGTQQHVDWSEKVVTQTGVRLAENLDWINEHSRMDMTEKRVIEADVFAQDDCWRLRTTCEFQNVSGEILRLGTFQSEEGLQGSHYTGMFLRLSRDFMGVGEWQPYGSYLAEGQHGVEQVHGVQSSWLACVGSHDNCNVSTTLICCDNPENPNYPVHWFYRPDMPCLALPFVGSGAVILEPNETLRLSYDFIIANGIREAEERHRLVREFVTERAAVQV